MKADDILTQAREVIRAEGLALLHLADQLGDSFVQTVRLVSECRGRVLISGAGTSGTIARRLAHLLSCCGTPSFYVHPADALHGSSAAIVPGDVVIALSKAGQSAELNQFVAIARQRGAKVVSWTSDAESELAKCSDIVVLIQTDASAEGEGVYPFGSSLAHAAVGDALALLSMRIRGFKLTELLQTHPSGATAKLVSKEHG
ncbi:MAG: SIS domain-containing protein [Chloroflexi bacterium]|nr:SIS domain-containing protein [Chloroflexota bacterium]